MGRYEYDAWGNITKITDYSYDTAGNLTTTDLTNNPNSRDLLVVNPIRYRGYYYDVETELYYLQSRYYNPEIGRFLNADGYITTDSDNPLTYNMFAYCMNNPVMYSDPSGCNFIELLDTLNDFIGLVYETALKVSSSPTQTLAQANGINNATNNIEGFNKAVSYLSVIAENLLEIESIENGEDVSTGKIIWDTSIETTNDILCVGVGIKVGSKVCELVGGFVGGVIGTAFSPGIGTVVGKVVGSTVGIAIGTTVGLVLNYALENTKSMAKGAWNK